jgi:NitT/TauT family transport system substrate-binding protein
MTLRVMVSRHAAFYSPLIATLAGGFLQEQGLDATYSVLKPGQRSHELIRDGLADVIQSAVSSNWKPMERGESPLPVHFAQINCRDGFFIAARKSNASFQWRDLEGSTLLADHGAQPLAMLRYAAKCQGIDWSCIQVIDAGSPEQMTAAFRSGTGDYVHLQGPGPQQLEHDRAGYLVASVGESMPPVTFSSLCASREFLATADCAAFLRAFSKAKQWVRSAPPTEVVSREASYFPGIEPAALESAIKRYQSVGCWKGGIEIPRDLYEQALNVFESAGAIAARHPYDSVCVDRM